MTDHNSNENPSGFDWGAIASTATPPTPDAQGSGQGAALPAAPAPQARASFGGSLPPFPPQTAIVVGRLPIQGDTGRAIIQLPEPVKGAHCAFTVANSGVLSDCYRTVRNACVPSVLRSRPLNDREFEVLLDAGDYTAKGLGWDAGAYPGAAPETRSIDTGAAYVEILAVIGIDCGCSSQDWASDNEWG